MRALFDVMTTIAGNDQGSLTVDLALGALNAALKFYDDTFLFPVGAAGTLFTYNFVLGKRNEAIEIDSTTASDDVVAGGNRDDIICGSSARDVIDGGAGTDTLDYAEVGGKLELTFGRSPTGNIAFDVDKDGKAKDSVANVETVMLGSGEDRVSLDADALSAHVPVDAGTFRALNCASAGSISILSCLTQASTLSMSACVRVGDVFGSLPKDIWRSLITVAFAAGRIR
ncbi:hypothetical protein H0176_21990 [Methylorubrum populi]|uniref:Uncharacterized protein n=1 Tax=Methylorubrum rhodesianum TaxID=29427 RepID=A0ABU9Z4T1_9HYPH|nr:hypothetical protein [Methylorubrum rhodesianum]MBK3402680.1 hypothetical protein [Methylorubrum rhodesianum]MBY0142923.1 hypothetical protein [Methylorubrum populi]